MSVPKSIGVTCALAIAASGTAACTVVPASQRTTAFVQPRLPVAGEVMTYVALADVPGPIEALGEIEVANKGESRDAIEARLRAEARRIGANAIVLHPFNRWALGAEVNTGGWDRFDPFRYSRATALLVDTAPTPAQ